ncbi:MAG: hypothetical protein OHK0046_02410 [Anaerolineae bacterium]
MAKRTTKPTTKTSGSARTTSSAGGGSRSRTRERRAERQRLKRRQQQMTLLIVGVIVAVVAVGLFILVNQPASAPVPEGTLERYAGIPQSETDEGFALLGNPDAPVLVEEYSSFSCPGCASFHESNFDYIVDQVREGVVAFQYIPMLTGSIPNARGAARAAICAGEQDMFYEMHDTLFNWHLVFGNQAFSQNRLNSGVEALGLDQSQYDSCIGSNRPDQVLEASEQNTAARQVNSTPTIFINGTRLEGSVSLQDAVQAAFINSGLPPVPVLSDEVEDAVTDEPAVDGTAEVTEEATVEAEATDAVEEVDATEEAAAEGEDAAETAEATEEAGS